MKESHKTKALRLRALGFSIKEISVFLKVSQSTVSVWVRKVKLNRMAVVRLRNRSKYGRIKGVEANRKRRNQMIEEIKRRAYGVISKGEHGQSLKKISASLLCWCEGSKTNHLLCFTNSDVSLVKTFLSLLRGGFVLDEKKFRVCLHLHHYHNTAKQIKFWSTVTKIPRTQFMRVYQKPNGGINIKKGYPGCVSIRYYDYRIFLELKFIWERFAQKHGGLV